MNFNIKLCVRHDCGLLVLRRHHVSLRVTCLFALSFSVLERPSIYRMRTIIRSLRALKRSKRAQPEFPPEDYICFTSHLTSLPWNVRAYIAFSVPLSLRQLPKSNIKFFLRLSTPVKATSLPISIKVSNDAPLFVYIDIELNGTFTWDWTTRIQTTSTRRRDISRDEWVEVELSRSRLVPDLVTVARLQPALGGVEALEIQPLPNTSIGFSHPVLVVHLAKRPSGSPIEKLPNELLTLIFEHLDHAGSFQLASRVCRLWADIAGIFGDEPESNVEKIEVLATKRICGLRWRNIRYSKDDSQGIDLKALIEGTPNARRLQIALLPSGEHDRKDIVDSLCKLKFVDELRIMSPVQNGENEAGCWSTEEIKRLLSMTSSRISILRFLHLYLDFHAAQSFTLAVLDLQHCHLFGDTLPFDLSQIRALRLKSIWPLTPSMHEQLLAAAVLKSLQFFDVSFVPHSPSAFQEWLGWPLRSPPCQFHTASFLKRIYVDGGHDSSQLVPCSFFSDIHISLLRDKQTLKDLIQLDLKYCSLLPTSFIDVMDWFFSPQRTAEGSTWNRRRVRICLPFGEWDEGFMSYIQRKFRHLRARFVLTEGGEEAEEGIWNERFRGGEAVAIDPLKR
ncbi:hypothetical protein BT69DRAFT_1299965 [Atractiella rhizophila]|nr:hypothetical protein BT69DRAFT_1299965 [Atractiella rhizophila]